MRLVALTLTLASLAASSFTQPTTVAIRGRISEQVFEFRPFALAIDAHGTEQLLWIDNNPEFGASQRCIRFASQKEGGSWTLPENLACDPTQFFFYPQLITHPTGERDALWTLGGEIFGVVQATHSTPKGNWTHPQTIGEDAIDPRLKVGPNGSAFASWVDEATERLFVTQRFSNGDWKIPEAVLPPIEIIEFTHEDAKHDLIVTPHGALVAGVLPGEGVFVAWQKTNGSWTEPTLIDPLGSRVKLLANSRGEVLALTPSYQEGSTGEMRAVSFCGGTWSLPEQLGPLRDDISSNTSEFFDGVVLENGTAHLIWASPNAQGTFDVVTSKRTPGRSWTPTQVLKKLPTNFFPLFLSIQSHPNQGVLAAWGVAASTGSPQTLYTSTLSPQGSWTQPERLKFIPERFSGLQVAASPSGRWSIAWNALSNINLFKGTLQVTKSTK